MERIIVKIGFAEHNYCALVELPDEVIAVTHKTLDGGEKAVLESLEFSKQTVLENNEPIPTWVQNGYDVSFELEISALLQHYGNIITRSALSRVTGINERQLGHYATGHRKPRPAQRDKIIQGFHQLGKEFSAI